MAFPPPRMSCRGLTGWARTGVFVVLASTAVGQQSSEFAWITPAPGESYGPGDLLNATWYSTTNIVSPSFKLCVASNNSSSFAGVTSQSSLVGRLEGSGKSRSSRDNASTSDECGGAVRPSADSLADQYTASLSIPLVTLSSLFYLLMESDLGDSYPSPNFEVLSNEEDSPSESADPPTQLFPGTAAEAGSAPVSSSPPTAPVGVAGSSSGSVTPSTPASGPSVRPLPIGPLTPPFPVYPDPNINGSNQVAAVGTYPSSYPFAPPGQGNIGNIAGGSGNPIITNAGDSGGLTPAEAAAEAAQKNGHAIAAAIAVPLGLMCLAVFIGLLTYFLIKKRHTQLERRIASIGRSNGADGGDLTSFTRLPHHPQRASTLSTASSMSSLLAEDEKALPSVPYQQPYTPPASGACYASNSLASGGVNTAPPHLGYAYVLPGTYSAPMAVQQSSLLHNLPPSNVPAKGLPRPTISRNLTKSSISSGSSYTTDSSHGAAQPSSSMPRQSQSQSQIPASAYMHPLQLVPGPAPMHAPPHLTAHFQQPLAHSVNHAQFSHLMSMPMLSPEHLTPPAIPTSAAEARAQAAYHGTMQTLLNSYFARETVPAPDPSASVGLPGAGTGLALSGDSGRPFISYSARPPVDLDARGGA